MFKVFIDEQECRCVRKFRDEIYDVMGWLLFLMFNIDIVCCGRSVEVESCVVFVDDKLIQLFINLDVKVVYFVFWGDMVVG